MMRRRVLATWAIGAVLLCFAGAVVTAPSAAAAGPGYVRIAHLSPDTPTVDVWLTSFRGGSFSKVFTGVGYGALSPYRRVTPGRYAVAVRSPGATKDSPPLLQTTLEVQSGKAYTVAGVGQNADLSLRVLTDDLTRPSHGSARIRVLQASTVAPVIGVATSTGAVLTRAATFPSTTAYDEVPARRLVLRATPEKPSVPPVQEAVNVRNGRVYTVLVLDKGTSGIQMLVRTDAAATPRTPAGGVNTGFGGSLIPQGQQGSIPGLVLGLLALAATAYTMRWRRRGL